MNCYNQSYKKIKKSLLEFQELHNEITNDKYHDLNSDSEQRRENVSRYRQFYSFVREELLLICGDVNKLLDYVIHIFYLDDDFISRYDDKAILWNCFEDEMVRRCNGDFAVNNIDENKRLKLLAKREKNLTNINKMKDNCKKVRIMLFENDYSEAVITKPEIKAIKKKIKGDVEAQRLFCTLLILARKLTINKMIADLKKLEVKSKTSGESKTPEVEVDPNDLIPIKIYNGVKNQINRSQINKLADIDGRKFDKLIKKLIELEVVEIGTKNLAVPKINVLFDVIEGEEAFCIRDVNELCSCLNRSFPYSKKKLNVKTA